LLGGQGEGFNLDKAETIAVLKELFAVCPEIGQAVFVSLDLDNIDVKSMGFYKITLRLNLDNELKAGLKKFLEARKLKFMETKDLAVIYGQKN
jgi:hypothetical protein